MLYHLFAAFNSGPRFVVDNQWVILAALVVSVIIWAICKFNYLALVVITILNLGFYLIFFGDSYTGDTTEIIWGVAILAAFGIYLYFKDNR